MRIDKLWIEEFKNLRDFSIDFDEDQMTTVLIGHNGTGKSNLIEAIAIIFRDLDLGDHPSFAYKITYLCRKHIVKIDADPDRNHSRTKITIDEEPISFEKFAHGSARTYLPKYVFAYYSGPNNRLESRFDKHQEIFYGKLLKGNDSPLRQLFYAKPIHSQFVLLSFFSSEDPDCRKFLNEYLAISELKSVVFILKEPSWKNEEGDERFWGAKGVIQRFLSKLYDYSLPPVRHYESVPIKHRRPRMEERLHLFIPDEQTLKKLAQNYNNHREFFKVLESIYIAELIHEVKITVKMKNSEDTMTFNELSEGEQQLLTVLGLLRFTKDEESLFLLDEPDTHLNPAWKLNYLDLLEDVAAKPKTSQAIICTHDPLVIGGLLRSQVQIFERDSVTGKITVNPPELDPKGMGVAALLTSELFGLNTTLDLATQQKLDRKRELYIKSLEGDLTKDEEDEMRKLSDELGNLDFTRTIRDPLYEKFTKAAMSREEFKKPVLTPAERRKQDEIAQQIIDEILREEET